MSGIVGHPIQYEFLVQIGDMTVSFAVLELQVQMLLEALVGQDQRVGQIIASQLSFARLRATVVGLYAERHGEGDDLSTLKERMNEAGEIERERNRITHSIWGVGTTSHKITRMKLTCRQKHGVQSQFEEYDEAKFLEFNDRIKRVTRDILGFYAKLQGGDPLNSIADNTS
jgi:hypothetical protein